MSQETLFAEPEVTISTSALYKEIIAAYEAEEAKVEVESVFGKVTYASPVNFRESMLSPRHRWFPYKEGFSPSFVQSFLKDHAPRAVQNVLDPFGGVGTTLIESSRLGLNAFGFEVSPMSHFIASTKAAGFDALDLVSLDAIVEDFQQSELQLVAPSPENDTVISYFEPAYLSALLRLKAFYIALENPKVSALFKLAFLNCLERYSTHRKAGNGVKRKTKFAYAGSPESPIEQIRNTVLNDLRVFRKDLAQEPAVKPFQLTLGSCLDESLYPDGIQFDAVLTSPPYANCFDYSKIYMVELWLGDFFLDKSSQKEFRAQSLRSHVHARWADRHTTYGSELINNQVFEFLSTQKLWSNQIPSMLAGYFADMGYLLHLLSSRCSPGAPIGLVVGNSYYGSLPIATDLILSMLGRQHGFEPIKISVYRNVVVSSQQFTRATDRKYMRESLVILKKK
ncbi:site-specific DNA-methyltransferase [Hymenobacter sp. BT175]|uniref:site-specific DNA-methyltransferase n=1 Tax=Hymenobacter translucens TaxID=2886507 RepID=UPI001D0E6278|nr:site-specific DNA-methyltransferase [Hymenobacter translucens]MCC2548534.1 site-specific DNA-methyltransferase [Hymenobacter translucens]